MKQRLFTLFTIIFFSTITLSAQNQEEPKSMEEMAMEEAARLERELNLEPHQAFYVDSILQHDMVAMDNEMQALRFSGTQDYKIYEEVRKKWLDKITAAFKQIFTEQQYINYLKETGQYRKEMKKKKEKASK